MDMTPVFWRVTDGITWVQVHDITERRALEKACECRRVSYSVTGPWLEVWELKRTPSWTRRLLKELFGESREVWGGDTP